MGLIARILVTAAALGAAAWLLDGIEVTEKGTAGALALVGVAIVFGLVNGIVGSVVKFLSLPFILLTLGLLLLVINGLLLLLTSNIAEAIGLGFVVKSFGSAVLGSIIISIVSWGLSAFIND